MSDKSLSSASGQAAFPLYAALIPIIGWAGNFVILRFALRFYGPLSLTALRFLLIGVTVVIFGWPKLRFRVVALYALLSAGGQYTLSTMAMYFGLSAGLTSLVMQAQVFFVAILGFLILRERPMIGTMLGSVFGFAGLALLTLAKGQTFSMLGFGICLFAALCWALSSLQLRVLKWGSFFSLQAASCLIAAPFVALLSWKFEAVPFRVETMLAHPYAAIGVLAYMAIVSLFVSQGIWSRLLMQYPVSVISPFALLIPVFGISLSYIFLGESLTAIEMISCVLVLTGLGFHFWSVRAKARA